MRGYEVVSSDGRTVGRVNDVKDGYLIVESGRLHTTRRPVPREFVHAVDEAAKAFVTVPRRVLREAPKVSRRGAFDRAATARHYGLAVRYEQPPDGSTDPAPRHDPAWGSERDAIAAGKEAPAHRRAELRKHMRPGYTDEEHHEGEDFPDAPALLGDRVFPGPRIKKGH